MTQRTVRLRSSDGEIFEVEESVAMQSATVKGLHEELAGGDDPIPLEQVHSRTLAKVVEWSKKHAGGGYATVRVNRNGSQCGTRGMQTQARMESGGR